MQIRSLSLKLLTPFNSIKLFQFMVTIETQGAFDCMRNPDLCPGFRFGNRTRNAKRISPSPPRNPSPNHDFMDFLYTVLVGKNCSREQCCFFCLICVRMRDNCSLKNSSNLFSQPRNTDYQRSNFTCIATTQTSNAIR